MENVLLIGQVTGGGFDDYFGRRLAVAPPPPPRRSIQGSFTFAAPSPPPFQYTTYEAASLYSSLSLPLHLPYTYYAAAAAASAPATATPLLPRMLPPLPPSATVVRRRIKKPRTPRSGEGQARAPQRRRPLERAAPLPPPAAVAEALDDLERRWRGVRGGPPARAGAAAQQPAAAHLLPRQGRRRKGRRLLRRVERRRRGKDVHAGVDRRRRRLIRTDIYACEICRRWWFLLLFMFLISGVSLFFHFFLQDFFFFGWKKWWKKKCVFFLEFIFYHFEGLWGN